jgi:hypothetical protein
MFLLSGCTAFPSGGFVVSILFFEGYSCFLSVILVLIYDITLEALF